MGVVTSRHAVGCCSISRRGVAVCWSLVCRQLGGPIWHDPIHDPEFVEEMVREGSLGLHPHPDSIPECDAGSNAKETVERSRQRMMGVLRSIASEVRTVDMLGVAGCCCWSVAYWQWSSPCCAAVCRASLRRQLPDAPLYYSVSSLSSVIHVRSPSMNEFLAGLVNAGYKVGQLPPNAVPIAVCCSPACPRRTGVLVASSSCAQAVNELVLGVLSYSGLPIPHQAGVCEDKRASQCRLGRYAVR